MRAGEGDARVRVGLSAKLELCAHTHMYIKPLNKLYLPSLIFISARLCADCFPRCFVLLFFHFCDRSIDEMVLSSSIEVRDSPVAGKGLFCTKPIKAGETIWTPDADEATKYYHTMAQIKSWSEEEQKHFMNNAYLVAPGTYSGALSRAKQKKSVPARQPGDAAQPWMLSPLACRRALWRRKRQGRVHEPLMRAQRP